MEIPQILVFLSLGLGLLKRSVGTDVVVEVDKAVDQWENNCQQFQSIIEVSIFYVLRNTLFTVLLVDIYKYLQCIAMGLVGFPIQIT